MRSGGSAQSLRRWWRSAGFAWAGVRHTWRTQANFRIESRCAVLALGTCAWLAVPPAPVVLACALVLSLELLNTSLEAAVDLASPALHPLARVAKDAAAAAVLMASVGALGVGASTLLPALWRRVAGG